MKKHFLIGIFMMLLMLVGCGNKVEPTFQALESIEKKEKIQVEVYLPTKVEAQYYESTEGIYIGAYSDKNISLGQDIRNYEAAVDKKQAFQVFQYKQSGDLKPLDLLKCIAAKQTPYIKILPDKSEDLTVIYQFIGDINQAYNIPLFVELYPVGETLEDPMSYKAYYQRAYKLIKKYNTDVTMVWSSALERAYDSILYYPGDQYVDWVGLNVYLPKYKANERYQPDYKECIDYWYKTYQEQKPMIISTLAVSHFSRVDHTYTIQDTKNKFAYFYDEMIQDYPRIRGILHADVDMYQVSSRGKDDYRITSQQKLLETIRSYFKQALFLEEVVPSEQEAFILPMVYTLETYKIEDGLYVTEQQLQGLYPPKKLKKAPSFKDAHNQHYYSLEWLVASDEGYIKTEVLGR